MKKLITLLLVVSSLACLAQTVKFSQLVNTSWKMVSPRMDNYDMIIKFSADTMSFISSYSYLNKKETLNETYYISSDVPTKFQKSLVGENLSGSYIAEYNGLMLMWTKVNSIENDTLNITNDQGYSFLFKKQ